VAHPRSVHAEIAMSQFTNDDIAAGMALADERSAPQGVEVVPNLYNPEWPAYKFALGA